jgi:hypothetical protein
VPPRQQRHFRRTFDRSLFVLERFELNAGPGYARSAPLDSPSLHPPILAAATGRGGRPRSMIFRFWSSGFCACPFFGVIGVRGHEWPPLSDGSVNSGDSPGWFESISRRTCQSSDVRPLHPRAGQRMLTPANTAHVGVRSIESPGVFRWNWLGGSVPGSKVSSDEDCPPLSFRHECNASKRQGRNCFAIAQ